MSPVIDVRDLSKVYRLGAIGTGTLREDIGRWWTVRVLGRPDPFSIIGSKDHGNRVGNRIWALQHVDLSVERGEIVGIIGRNGAGKSTLLKILARITGPTAGEVKIKGSLSSMLEVGTGFHGELTGRENIHLQGTILGMSKRDIHARYERIVEFAELARFMETPVKRYSSGMFLRLAFAVACYLESEIMIVDEILGVGDIGFQRKCIGKMLEIARSGRTILFVSHRMDQIRALCPRSILLDAGRKVADGTTGEVLQKYFASFETFDARAIATRTDRIGRGRVRFTGAWIENERGERVKRLRPGERATFVLILANKTPAPVKNLYVSIAIFSLDNLFIGSISTRECLLPPIEVADGARVEFTIDDLPLNPGQFYINANVQTSLGAYEFDDLVENAGTFDVVASDPNNSSALSAALLQIKCDLDVKA
jgi:lipopolysaccharide transport system ATP-binding protein